MVTRLQEEIIFTATRTNLLSPAPTQAVQRVVGQQEEMDGDRIGSPPPGESHVRGSSRASLYLRHGDFRRIVSSW
jgi:hypothetical protein